MEHQLTKKQHLHSNPAFVIGNGTSRQGLHIKSLMHSGVIYGCNAQYREFEPHYLIAVDVKMVNEIVESGYHKRHQVWTNPNKGIQTKHGINFFSPHKGWSSGPTALWFAASQEHRTIYIFGFDYQGHGGKFNNVYANTYNYKKATDPATFFGNWLSQTEKVIKEFRHTQFFRVIEPGAFIPDKLGPTLSNLSHITYKEFSQTFPAAIYSNQINQNITI